MSVGKEYEGTCFSDTNMCTCHFYQRHRCYFWVLILLFSQHGFPWMQAEAASSFRVDVGDGGTTLQDVQTGVQHHGTLDVSSSKYPDQETDSTGSLVEENEDGPPSPGLLREHSTSMDSTAVIPVGVQQKPKGLNIFAKIGVAHLIGALMFLAATGAYLYSLPPVSRPVPAKPKDPEAEAEAEAEKKIGLLKGMKEACDKLASVVDEEDARLFARQFNVALHKAEESLAALRLRAEGATLENVNESLVEASTRLYELEMRARDRIVHFTVPMVMHTEEIHGIQRSVREMAFCLRRESADFALPLLLSMEVDSLRIKEYYRAFIERAAPIEVICSSTLHSRLCRFGELSRSDEDYEADRADIKSMRDLSVHLNDPATHFYKNFIMAELETKLANTAEHLAKSNALDYAVDGSQDLQLSQPHRLLYANRVQDSQSYKQYGNIVAEIDGIAVMSPEDISKKYRMIATAIDNMNGPLESRSLGILNPAEQDGNQLQRTVPSLNSILLSHAQEASGAYSVEALGTAMQEFSSRSIQYSQYAKDAEVRAEESHQKWKESSSKLISHNVVAELYAEASDAAIRCANAAKIVARTAKNGNAQTDFQARFNALTKCGESQREAIEAWKEAEIASYAASTLWRFEMVYEDSKMKMERVATRANLGPKDIQENVQKLNLKFKNLVSEVPSLRSPVAIAKQYAAMQDVAAAAARALLPPRKFLGGLTIA